MHITPDEIVLWRWGFVQLNATIVFTWIVMLLLTLVSWLVTRRLTTSVDHRSRWQTGLEAVVELIRGQIHEICPRGSDTYLPFVGTLFLFIAVSNVLDIVPGWHPPTGSLSTTAALAISVGVAVPAFGILRQGVTGYLRHYLRPSWIILPFHLLSETTRNLALAVRLFGNIMSGTMIAGILLAIAPLFVPVLMQALGLLIGLIQAYIFAVLAMVYIGAAVQREQEGAS
ncbi:MAG TPA: F0F1 ATP synthase subunit A [Bryobacteraceae bacterium]|nr:F0F1 ATP synthase subunit A [Bryobacteraceae bacterium]